MKRGSSPALGEEAADRDAPTLSVILPVYNAMPWLPIAVRDMLKQDLGGERLELLCCDDGSSDGSLAFLQELSSAMGPCAAFEAKRRRTEDPSAARPSAAAATTTEEVSEGGAQTTNPAFVAALRAPEDADHPSFAGQEAPEEARMLMENPLTPEEVLAHVRPEHTLLVLSSHPEGLNLGQGAAMTACLRRARGPFIAQMESDDVRERCDAFKVMLEELRSRPELDAVGCLAACVGWKREGMERYTSWQNALLTPEENALGRFIEEPALHQTAVFRASCIREVLEKEGGCYRDGRAGEGLGGSLDVPVDYFFWLSFYHAGKQFAKVDVELFGWRQHPRQHTRTHGRLSVEALRKLKAYFMCREGGPGHGKDIEVWSVGKTLDSWVEELRTFGAKQVKAVEWKPGAPVAKKKKGEAEGVRPMRLFAFGLEKARLKTRQVVRDWNDEFDMFVA